jgi:hypothetical protein
LPKKYSHQTCSVPRPSVASCNNHGGPKGNIVAIVDNASSEIVARIIVKTVVVTISVTKSSDY